jgi:hypothetical protein
LFYRNKNAATLHEIAVNKRGITTTPYAKTKSSPRSHGIPYPAATPAKTNTGGTQISGRLGKYSTFAMPA